MAPDLQGSSRYTILSSVLRSNHYPTTLSHILLKLFEDRIQTILHGIYGRCSFSHCRHNPPHLTVRQQQPFLADR